VETWLSQGVYIWTLEDKAPIVSIVVDLDHVLPDDDRSNNKKKSE